MANASTQDTYCNTELTEKVTIGHHWTLTHIKASGDSDQDSPPGNGRQWTMRNELLVGKVIRSHDPDKTGHVKSPVFQAEGQKWRVQLRSNTNTWKHYGNLIVSVELLSKDVTDMLVSIVVSIIDGDADAVLTDDAKDRPKALMAVSALGATNLATGSINSGSVVFCEGSLLGKTLKTEKLTIAVDINILRASGGAWNDVPVPRYSIRADLEDALDFSGETKGKDVTLVTRDQDGQKRNFGAHKFMLAARSPVFAKMFEHDLSENQLNAVDIDDIEPDVLEQTLRFIYTGDPDIGKLNEKTIPLLHAAEKYQLKRLKAQCERSLAVGVKVENAANLLLIAHRYNAEGLKKFVMKFVALNGNEVMKTEEWESVEKAGLDREILLTIFSDFQLRPPSKKAKVDV